MSVSLLTTASDRLYDVLHRRRNLLLIVSVVLVVFGLRLAVGERFTSPIPFADDWNSITWFENWARGNPDWGFVFVRESAHLCVVGRLASLGCYLANQGFDLRLEFVLYAASVAVYAGILAFLMMRCVPRRAGVGMAVVVAALLGVPFGGYRVAWGPMLLYGETMFVSLLAFYFLLFKRGTIWGGSLALALSLVAAVSVGSGCLAALAGAGIILLRGFVERRVKWMDVALFVVCLGIFAWFYLSTPGRGGVRELPIRMALLTFLNTLSWPNFFLPVSCFLTMLPSAALLWKYWREPIARTKENEFLLVMTAFLVLQAAAIGLFRNDGGGVPSNRYTEILVLYPVVSLACWLALGRLSPLPGSIRLIGLVICCLYVFGGGLHFLYRTWPFLARENGEWVGAAEHAALRQWVASGNKSLPPGFPAGEPTNAERLPEWIAGSETNPVLSRAEVLGWPMEGIETKTRGFFRPGFPPSYAGRPTQTYLGSCSPESGEQNTGSFVSRSFTPRNPYLKFDLVLDKRSRFSLYKVPGCSLHLVEDKTGKRFDLLALLRTSFPSILRDREAIHVRVSPGMAYHIEAVDDSPSAWFAFSEPRESRRMTPVTEGLLDSGKLMTLAGLGLFTVAVMGGRQLAADRPLPPKSIPNLVEH